MGFSQQQLELNPFHQHKKNKGSEQDGVMCVIYLVKNSEITVNYQELTLIMNVTKTWFNIC